MTTAQAFEETTGLSIAAGIKKAIEGGYNGYPIPFCQECGGYETPNGQPSMFLDPLFWQSLGKAMGWKRTEKEYHWAEIELARERWNNSLQRDMEKRGSSSAVTVILEQELHQKINAIKETEAWRFEWNRFIDHLAEGKDAESFFKNL